MAEVHQRPRRRKVADLPVAGDAPQPQRYRYPSSAVHPQDLEPLDWHDPVAVRDWLHGLRCQVHDVVSIARDNRHARSYRILPPRVARSTVADATRALRLLLRKATLGLPELPQEGAP